MKLQHLPMGARFEYEGEIHVKTGPMTASSEAGGQRIIPRYATLQPLEAPAAESKAPIKGRLDAVRVRTAFERFYETSERLVGECGLQELVQARQTFLDAIK